MNVRASSQSSGSYLVEYVLKGKYYSIFSSFFLFSSFSFLPFSSFVLTRTWAELMKNKIEVSSLLTQVFCSQCTSWITFLCFEIKEGTSSKNTNGKRKKIQRGSSSKNLNDNGYGGSCRKWRELMEHNVETRDGRGRGGGKHTNAHILLFLVNLTKSLEYDKIRQHVMYPALTLALVFQRILMLQN